MGLKQLLEHYLQDDDAVANFDRDPEAAFRQFAVSDDERNLLLSASSGDAAADFDPELVRLLDQVRARRPHVHLLYPDADLKIVSVEGPAEGIIAGQLVELKIELTWDHDEQPVSGLPRTVQICAKHRDDPDAPRIRENTTPVLIDLLGRVREAGGSTFAPLMGLREAVLFDRPGAYLLHIGLNDYPAESDPVLVTVRDAS